MSIKKNAASCRKVEVTFPHLIFFCQNAFSMKLHEAVALEKAFFVLNRVVLNGSALSSHKYQKGLILGHHQFSLKGNQIPLLPQAEFCLNLVFGMPVQILGIGNGWAKSQIWAELQPVVTDAPNCLATG